MKLRYIGVTIEGYQHWIHRFESRCWFIQHQIRRRLYNVQSYMVSLVTCLMLYVVAIDQVTTEMQQTCGINDLHNTRSVLQQWQQTNISTMYIAYCIFMLIQDNTNTHHPSNCDEWTTFENIWKHLKTDKSGTIPSDSDLFIRVLIGCDCNSFDWVGVVLQYARSDTPFLLKGVHITHLWCQSTRI